MLQLARGVLHHLPVAVATITIPTSGSHYRLRFNPPASLKDAPRLSRSSGIGPARLADRLADREHEQIPGRTAPARVLLRQPQQRLAIVSHVLDH